jgi:hypothetical protein
MSGIYDYITNFGEDLEPAIEAVLTPQGPVNQVVAGMVYAANPLIGLTATPAGGQALASTVSTTVQPSIDYAAEDAANFTDNLDVLQQTALQWALIAGGAVLGLLVLNDILMERRSHG